MNAKVKLEDIIEALDICSDALFCYVNKKTGEVVSVSEEYFNYNEDDMDDIAEWEREEISLAKAIENSDDYLSLPDQYEVNEYQLMEFFCIALPDGTVKEKMLYSIKGKGAFRRFKDAVHEYGLAESWYQYRNACIKDFAIEWCEQNGFECEEGDA